jgi:hypothetical protein
MKRWPQLLVVIVLSAMTFGGSFTCKASTNDDDDRPNKPRPAAPAQRK